MFCVWPERNFVYHEGEDASEKGGVKWGREAMVRYTCGETWFQSEGWAYRTSNNDGPEHGQHGRNIIWKVEGPQPSQWHWRQGHSSGFEKADKRPINGFVKKVWDSHWGKRRGSRWRQI